MLMGTSLSWLFAEVCCLLSMAHFNCQVLLTVHLAASLLLSASLTGLVTNQHQIDAESAAVVAISAASTLESSIG
jgi:hypothetical protein